jgi:hypothetical protein
LELLHFLTKRVIRWSKEIHQPCSYISHYYSVCIIPKRALRWRRGISVGIVHSQYDSNGKRILVRHAIGTMGTAMGTEKAGNRFLSDNKMSSSSRWWGEGDLNPRPPAPQAGIMDQIVRPKARIVEDSAYWTLDDHPTVAALGLSALSQMLQHNLSL